MRHPFYVTFAALMFSVATITPAMAQNNSTDTVETDGNFSRQIPEGQKANLTEQELADFQRRLDAATTPQERNAVRQELQRTNQERHLAKVQGNKYEPMANEPKKGFFESMRDDFRDIVSGKAMQDAKAAKASDDAQNKRLSKTNDNSKSGNKGGNKGGNSGGNGGGNGGGKNK